MKVRHLGIAAYSATACAVVIACSTAATSPPGTPDAGSTDSSAAVDGCMIAPGTYNEHYAKGRGTADCGQPLDRTIVISARGVRAPDLNVAGDYYKESECFSKDDKATCTFTAGCSRQGGGLLQEETVVIVVTKGKVTGSSHDKRTSQTGAAQSDCVYDFTYEKQ